MAQLLRLLASLVRRPCAMLSDGDTALDALTSAVFEEIAFDSCGQHQKAEAFKLGVPNNEAMRPRIGGIDNTLCKFRHPRVTIMSPTDGKSECDLCVGE